MSNPYAPPPPTAPQRPDRRGDATGGGREGEPPDARAAGDPAGTPPGDGTSAPDHDARAHPRAPSGTVPQGTVPPGAPPAGAPAGHRGRPPAAGARPPLPPQDPEAVLRTGRLVRHFGVWLLASVAVSLLPLPWRAATVAFLLGAVVTGIRALRAVAVARLRGGLGPLLVAGLALTGLLGAGTLGSFALWPAETARQECLAGALTVSARSACDRAYQDALDDLTAGITGGP